MGIRKKVVVVGILILMLALAGLPAFLYPKGHFALWLNYQHTPFLDVFFKYATYLGDGALFAVLGILLLFKRFYYALVLGIIAAVQTVVIHVLKRIIFAGTPRPKAFFEELDIPIQLVEGVKVHAMHSFPSGHTATAFALATFAAWVWPKTGWQILFFVLAAIAGLSRIYLMQHFYIDVFFGSITGMLVAEGVSQSMSRTRLANPQHTFWGRRFGLLK